MNADLIKHFRKYVRIETKDEVDILNFFEKKVYQKKEDLINLNSRCNFHFFVVEGCLRMFFIDDRGNEQTIQFAIENWWLTDYLAFNNQAVSAFTIQAVENTNILRINYQDQENLLLKFPQLERYFRLIYQRAYSASLFRTKYHFDFSKEQLYHHFNDNFPDFTQRIPQHLLASYLNMTPEYLSEIKKRATLKLD